MSATAQRPSSEARSVGVVDDTAGAMQAADRSGTPSPPLDPEQSVLRLSKPHHPPSIPRPPAGLLGDLPPLLSSPLDLGWVFSQIRDCPHSFADKAEALFIHGDMFRSTVPAPLRTAFGICARAVSTPAGGDRTMLFRVLDAETAELLNKPTPAASSNSSTLLDDLARLQAVVLYTIIRFFDGDLSQRILAERQEYLIRAQGLKLLQRADAELLRTTKARPNPQAGTSSGSWETWILAESIRRTVFIAFKLYTLYWTFKYGTCIETIAMSMLPLSIVPGSWSSRDVYLSHSDGERDGTTTYAEFEAICGTETKEDLGEFGELLIMSCRGAASLHEARQGFVDEVVSEDYRPWMASTAGSASGGEL
jgi:hypothetical protein